MGILAQVKQVVAALADPEVDRRTGVLVATVTVAVPAAGQIIEVKFWNPATGAWEATPPKIVVGQVLGVAVLASNPSSHAMAMHADITFKGPSPSGVTTTQTTPIARVDPGYSCWFLGQVAAGLIGSWTADIILYAESIT